MRHMTPMDSEIFFKVKLSDLIEEQLSKFGIDAPIAAFVGTGQRAARDLAANACVVQLLFKCSQTALDITQVFPDSQLRRGHAQKLIVARK